MLNRIRKARQEESGFTLIELLIVIIILGILAAIVVFAIGNTRKDAVGNSCKTDFKAIELAAEAVKTKTGTYGDQASLSDAAKGGLLKEYPTSKNYDLVYASTGAAYTINVFANDSNGAVTGSTLGATVADCEDLN